jgi:hypothetical protein
MDTRKMPGGEDASKRQSSRCEDVCGLLEYLNWREDYEASNRSGQLGFLFCMAFDVNDSSIKGLEDDLMADSLIRSTYCYDDFVS